MTFAFPWRDYAELSKARLSALVLLTTGVGFWLGVSGPQRLAVLAPTCLGTALVVWGANALNQWLERGPDALMPRTQHRPLPSGRMHPASALRFGLWTSVAGLAMLAVAVNFLSALLALVSWVSYVLCYTPAKRWTPLCTLIGAVPGALPPMIGWAAARGTLGPEAWSLCAILVIWQIPHFLALAVLYRDEYARAGFPMLPLIEPDGSMTSRQILLYSMALLPVSLFPALTGIAAAPYFYGAFLLSLAFMALGVRAAWARSRRSARELFLGSVVYLPALLGWLALNRAAF